MDAILVFDSHNDLVVVKWNEAFRDRLIKIAIRNEILSEEDSKRCVNDINRDESLRNVIILMLAPFVASQRINCEKQEEFLILDCLDNSKATFTIVS